MMNAVLQLTRPSRCIDAIMSVVLQAGWKSRSPMVDVEGWSYGNLDLSPLIQKAFSLLKKRGAGRLESPRS